MLTASALCAQTTKVRGRVTESGTGEPVPFAAVFFDGTSIGISTDEDGRYYLETRDSSATVLTAQMLGYVASSHPVPYGAFSEVDFELLLDASQLTAARIVPDDSYVRLILDRIDRNREMHDHELGDPWSVDVYSKVELDATHAEWLATKSVLRRLLGDVVKWRDTSAVTGQSYIPIMLSETLSRKYHNTDPPVDKEILLANRISGVPSDNFLRQYSGSYLLSTNFYKSTITLFNLDVPSPVSAYGRIFYNYFLVDSLEMDGRKSYCLRFHPKPGVTSPTFDGEFFIDAEDYGIRSAHIALSKRSNVNWIRHINIDSDSRRTASGRWFPKEEKLFIDFSIAVSDSSKVVSFLGNRLLHYGEPGCDPVPQQALESPDAVVALAVEEPDEERWEELRPVPLATREKGIFEMVEEIKRKPSWNFWYTFGRTLVTGYTEGEHNKVAVGPWTQMLKYNATEGWHAGIGLRTTRHFSEKLRLQAGAGYGFRDHLVKGNASMEYVFRRDVWRKLTVSGRFDYQQLGQGSSPLAQPGLIGSLAGGGDKQTLIRDLALTYEHEHTSVFTSFLSLESRRMYGNDLVPLRTVGGGTLNSVSVNQLRYTARFAWQERIDRGRYKKSHIFTRYPVVGLDLTGGIRGITGDDFGFFRAALTFDWKIPAGAFGFGNVHIDGGAILGEVPYPFLKLHEGNQSFFLDKTAFTCMDYYEFASDRWVSTLYEHNLNGFLLGRIPLINKLDLREIITVKAAVGTISDLNRNRGRVLLPEGMSSLEIPYVEAGVGLSNLFRVLRVDVAWRITHRREVERPHVTVGFDVQF